MRSNRRVVDVTQAMLRLGAVGLAVIQGAKVAGALKIIAVDVNVLMTFVLRCTADAGRHRSRLDPRDAEEKRRW